MLLMIQELGRTYLVFVDKARARGSDIAALEAQACTTILVGKDASTDGSVLVSHSDDGLGDARLIYVPAMDHKPGSMRAVFYSHCALDFKPQWGGSESQRMMTTERGPGYDTPGVPKSVPLGFIPQVAHTYAYFDANYGIMNEHQLSIGECTDKAKVHPEPEAGKRIFYSAELSRVVRMVGLGVPMQRALAEMARRMENDDLDLVVTAISVQYELGGNLAQTLETISETIRDRVRIKREIRSLTGQQRATAYILAIMPVATAAILYVINPSYIGRLFEPGWIRILPAGAAVMIALGFMVMNKIVAIEV
jgi:hypothetical protein